MEDDRGSIPASSRPAGTPLEIFCDSNVLLNHLNREWEAPNGVELLEDGTVYIVISEQIEEEVRALVSRRQDLYTDVLKFVLGQDSPIEEYSHEGYLQPNDFRHLTSLMMELSAGDQNEGLKRFREFISRYRRSAEQLFELYIDEVVLTSAPFLFEMDLGDVIPNSADRSIVAGAADWASQGGSGFFVTNDTGDIVCLCDEINTVIEKHLGADSVLIILRPREVDIPSESPNN